jgi:hypothetical protein
MTTIRTTIRHHALVAGLASLGLCFGLAAPVPASLAAEQPSANQAAGQIDADFSPQTGQINPGVPIAMPRANDSPSLPIPPTAEARQALMNGDFADPLPGPPTAPSDQTPNAEAASKAEQAAKAIDSTSNGSTPPAVSAETGRSTTGSASAGETSAQQGPIGSSGQTLPAKFSKRNDTLDRLPTMAVPYRLNDEQRRRLIEAASKAPVVDGIDKLKPADQLTTQQAQNMTALPQTAAPGLTGLKMLKGKDRVLLVEPSNRIVVDEIAG